jgi:catechol 2,3-dioxygenase-like lactoylglutathione lyase family enzyme
MIRGARYAHTNLVARDYVRLAGFYEGVFGCVPVPPERDYGAAELEGGTAVRGAGLRGRHLRLPGHGNDGPTLEVFQYLPGIDAEPSEVHRPGYGHIAFAVEDVTAAHAEVLANGGTVVGEIVVLHPIPGRTVTWCYVRDPEGNVIELQSWSDA